MQTTSTPQPMRGSQPGRAIALIGSALLAGCATSELEPCDPASAAAGRDGSQNRASFTGAYLGSEDHQHRIAQTFFEGEPLLSSASLRSPADWIVKDLWPGGREQDSAEFFQDEDFGLPGDSNDSDPDFGADSVHLLFYMGHGTPQEWQVPGIGKPGSTALAAVALGNHELRYLFQCSCNVMWHGTKAEGGKRPDRLVAQACDGEGNDHFNALYRWASKDWYGDFKGRPAALQAGLRMACGGSTKICRESQGPATRIWRNYHQERLGPADAFLSGTSSENEVALCLSRGGRKPGRVPLVADLDFRAEQNEAGNGHYVYAQYGLTKRLNQPPPTPFVSTLPSYALTVPSVPALGNGPSVLGETRSWRGLRLAHVDERSGSFAAVGRRVRIVPWRRRTLRDARSAADRARSVVARLDNLGLAEADLDAAEIEVLELFLDRSRAEDLGCEELPRRFAKGFIVRFWRTVPFGTGTSPEPGARWRVFGPGAHLTVVLDPYGGVVGVARVGWRNLAPSQPDPFAGRILTVEQAEPRARVSLPAGTDFTRSNVELGYFEAPGGCRQGRLEPVYRFLFEPTGQAEYERLAQEVTVLARLGDGGEPVDRRDLECGDGP